MGKFSQLSPCRENQSGARIPGRLKSREFSQLSPYRHTALVLYVYYVNDEYACTEDFSSLDASYARQSYTIEDLSKRSLDSSLLANLGGIKEIKIISRNRYETIRSDYMCKRLPQKNATITISNFKQGSKKKKNMVSAYM